MSMPIGQRRTALISGPLALAAAAAVGGVLAFWFAPLLARGDQGMRFGVSLASLVFLLPLVFCPPGVQLASELRIEGDEIVARGIGEARARLSSIVSVTCVASAWHGWSRSWRLSVFVAGRHAPFRVEGVRGDIDTFLRALSEAPGVPRTFRTAPHDLRSLLTELPAVGLLAAGGVGVSSALKCVYPAQLAIGFGSLLAWMVLPRLVAWWAPYRCFRFHDGVWLTRDLPMEAAPKEYRPWMDAVASAAESK